MTIDEIQKGAPSGATHYSCKTGEYLRGENGDYDLWLNERWNPISIELDFSNIYDIFDVKPL